MVAAEGSHAIALAGDAALPEFAEDAVQKTMNAFGRIDILVNNAGVQYLHDSIKNITHKQVRRLRLNAPPRSPFSHFTRAAA